MIHKYIHTKVNPYYEILLERKDIKYSHMLIWKNSEDSIYYI